jgi:hypothetical protein
VYGKHFADVPLQSLQTIEGMLFHLPGPLHDVYHLGHAMGFVIDGKRGYKAYETLYDELENGGDEPPASLENKDTLDRMHKMGAMAVQTIVVNREIVLGYIGKLAYAEEFAKQEGLFAPTAQLLQKVLL